MKAENSSALEIEMTYNSLVDETTGRVTFQQMKEVLSQSGISEEDPRVKENLRFFKNKNSEEEISLTEFELFLKNSNSGFLKNIFQQKLAIPHFSDFKKDIEEIFSETKKNKKGEPDETLPHPGTDDEPAFAVSICTVDGQLLQLGDHDLAFSIQSICKAINYAIALEDVGHDKLHNYVGVEPGDEDFDTGKILNNDNLPHNPLINSGAIMTSTFIKPEEKMEDRLQYVMDIWENMTGNRKVEYKDDAFKAEWNTANKNMALAHLMEERGAFPEEVEINDAVKFYLKCCAIEVNIDDMAHAAATLANYGRCPSTGTKVFSHNTVRDTLSLMLSSGTYDHSGEFAFRVGMPAKSGIAGGLMVVVPNLLGVAVYSPPLDELGNSVRGLEFCERLVDKFNFHKFDANNPEVHGKKDPRLYKKERA